MLRTLPEIKPEICMGNEIHGMPQVFAFASMKWRI
jgi:hypothetical protein